MKMYIWTVHYGCVVAVAETLEEAIKLANEEYPIEYKEPDEVKEIPCSIAWIE